MMKKTMTGKIHLPAVGGGLDGSASGPKRGIQPLSHSRNRSTSKTKSMGESVRLQTKFHQVQKSKISSASKTQETNKKVGQNPNEGSDYVLFNKSLLLDLVLKLGAHSHRKSCRFEDAEVEFILLQANHLIKIRYSCSCSIFDCDADSSIDSVSAQKKGLSKEFSDGCTRMYYRILSACDQFSFPVDHFRFVFEVLGLDFPSAEKLSLFRALLGIPPPRTRSSKKPQPATSSHMTARAKKGQKSIVLGDKVNPSQSQSIPAAGDQIGTNGKTLKVQRSTEKKTARSSKPHARIDAQTRAAKCYGDGSLSTTKRKNKSKEAARELSSTRNIRQGMAHTRSENTVLAGTPTSPSLGMTLHQKTPSSRVHSAHSSHASPAARKKAISATDNKETCLCESVSGIAPRASVGGFVNTCHEESASLALACHKIDVDEVPVSRSRGHPSSMHKDTTLGEEVASLPSPVMSKKVIGFSDKESNMEEVPDEELTETGSYDDEEGLDGKIFVCGSRDGKYFAAALSPAPDPDEDSEGGEEVYSSEDEFEARNAER